MGVRVEQRLIREGLVRGFESRGVATVVTATSSLTELLRVAQVVALDVAVVEVREGETSARGSLTALRQADPQLRIVVLHEGLDSFELHRLRRAGAHAAVHSHDGFRGLIGVVCGGLEESKVPVVADAPKRIAHRPQLTSREQQVLELVATGLTSRTISTHLDVSPKTVENHKQRIFNKLEVQSQGHAVAVALRLGLISAIPARALSPVHDAVIATAAAV
jgi:DNA-binding NarL/FixJ family response regulator